MEMGLSRESLSFVNMAVYTINLPGYPAQFGLNVN